MSISARVTNQQPITATVTSENVVSANVSVPATVQATVSGGVGPQGPSGVSSWNDIVDRPATFPPSIHTHSLLDVTGLQDALAGKQPVGAYVITTDARLSDARVPLPHTHTASQIVDFTSAVIAAAPPTTNASLLTSGTLDAARLPAGVVLTTDSRLSDARTPLSHTHTASQISDFTTAVIAAAPPTTNASLLVSGTLDTARLPASVVLTTDARLSDARQPLTHQHSIADVGELQAALNSKATPSDVSAAQAYAVQRANHTGTQAAATISDFSAAAIAATASSYAAASHTHTAGQVSGLATVATTGSYADLTNKPTIPSATTSASDLTSGTLADARLSANVVLTTDSRLTNSRTPTAHAASHATGGSDAITPSSIGAVATSDSRLTDSRTPTGAAGGDLTGTYPNPQIAPGAVTTADIADNAVTNAKVASVAASKITGLPSGYGRVLIFG